MIINGHILSLKYSDNAEIYVCNNCGYDFLLIQKKYDIWCIWSNENWVKTDLSCDECMIKKLLE
jgi:hypothetical protein